MGRPIVEQVHVPESASEAGHRGGRAPFRLRGSSAEPSGIPKTPTNPPTEPTKVNGGEWGTRAPLISALSELAFAEANGKIYLLGGYPARRITARTVQVYDIANDRWELGPQLPLPNNHGMAAGVHGKIYLIGGQTTADDPSYVDTVWELDPATVPGLRRRRCPRRAVPAWQRCTTARSTWPADVRRGETTSPCTTPGLRSLYFLLADVVHRFMYLKYGLAAVLVFVGAKMMLVDVYKVPVVWSLAVISLLIGSAIAASLLWSRGPAPTMSGRASGTSRRIIGSARMSRS